MCAYATFVPTQFVMSDDIVSQVNTAKAGWVAGRNEYFENMDIETARKMMGTKHMTAQTRPAPRKYTPSSLPTSFDARTQWPSCVGAVLDQGRCGSCWAFGCAESVSDRMCISGAANNTAFLQLAALDLTINDQMNAGCQGGDPGSAWMWAVNQGLVSEACLPYGKWETPNAGPVPTCQAAKEPCMPNTFVPTPPANKKCADGSTYTSDKHHLKSAYSLTTVNDIMADLVENGPMEAAFTVYMDFLTYKSGVYKHTSGAELGGHAVKIIGYGTLNGEAYWLVQNSWTSTWGANGYFMIAKGVDECGFESDVVAGVF
jgi:cathepsin B